MRREGTPVPSTGTMVFKFLLQATQHAIPFRIRRCLRLEDHQPLQGLGLHKLHELHAAWGQLGVQVRRVSEQVAPACVSQSGGHLSRRAIGS